MNVRQVSAPSSYFFHPKMFAMNLQKASFYEKPQERNTRKLAFGIGFGKCQALCYFYPTMKEVYTLLFFIAVKVQISAQSPGFNKRFPIEYPNTRIFKVLVDKDTIIALGDGFSDTAFTEKGIVLMKLDTFGNLIQSNYIYDSIFGPFPVPLRWGSLLKTTDGGYIMNITAYGYEYPLILKTDHEFNLEFIKKYQEPGDYDYQLCDMISLSDGYLMHGIVGRSTGLYDGYLRKINFEGDSIWLKTFGTLGTSESINDVAFINDSTLLVIMVQASSNDVNAKSLLKIINLNGEVLSEWESEYEPDIGYLRAIVSADNDGFLLYGLYVAQVLPPNNTKLVMSTFSKLDSDFNIEKVQHYGKKVSLASEIMFYDFVETIDGNYIAAGRTSTVAVNNGPTYARGWLMKFSPEGDSIWSRLDTSDIMPVHYSNQQRLGGVGVLSSGSIIAGGYVARAEDNSSYIWLIKTTNDGCIDTLYCGLVSGTEEVPYVADVQRVSVYPNPANEVVHIQVPGISSKASMEINVFDLSGQQRKVLFADTEGDLPLPVSDLPSGIYFISIKLPDGRVQYGKFCVAH
jgi:hypothetical protein